MAAATALLATLPQRTGGATNRTNTTKVGANATTQAAAVTTTNNPQPAFNASIFCHGGLLRAFSVSKPPSSGAGSGDRLREALAWEGLCLKHVALLKGVLEMCRPDVPAALTCEFSTSAPFLYDSGGCSTTAAGMNMAMRAYQQRHQSVNQGGDGGGVRQLQPCAITRAPQSPCITCIESAAALAFAAVDG